MSAHEPLDPQERELAARLAEWRVGSPPPAVEQAILAQARAAARAAGARPARRRAWLPGLAAAAVLVLAVGVVWRVLENPPEPVRMEKGVQPPTPVPALAPAGESARPAEAGAGGPVQRKEKDGWADQPAPRAFPSVPAATTPAVPAPASATPRQVAPAGPVPGRPPPSVPGEAPPPPPAPVPSPAPVEAQRPRPGAPPPPAMDTVVPPSPRESVRETVPPAAERSMAPQSRAAAADPFDESVGQVRELLRQGRHGRALQALRELRELHPERPLPEDLRALLAGDGR